MTQRHSQQPKPLLAALALITALAPLGWDQPLRAQGSGQIPGKEDHAGIQKQPGPSNPLMATITSGISKRLATVDDLISEDRLVEANRILDLTIEDPAIDWDSYKTERAALLLYKGVLSYLLGDSTNAEASYQKALKTLAQARYANVQLELATLNQAAVYYLAAKNYGKAFTLLTRAREIIDYNETDGESQVLVGTTLSNLGYHAFQTRQPASARQLLTQAIEVLSSTADNSRFLFAALNNLYVLEISEENLPNAAALLSEAKKLALDRSGATDQELVTYYYNAAAFYYYLQKNYDLVISYTRSGLSAQRRQLMSQLPNLAIGKRDRFFKSVTQRGEAAEWLHWWTESFPGAAPLALETSLNSKGLIQDLNREQAQILQSNSNYELLTKNLNSLLNEYSSLNATQAQRRSLLSKIDKSQEELYRTFPAPALPEVAIQDVSLWLPSKGALIEMRKYRNFLGDFTSDSQQWGEARYLALILKPDQSITAVQLGPAAPIEAAIHRALQASSQNQSDAEVLWGQVSDLVLKPLAPALAGSNQWFISPDAELNRVPFAALPSPLDPGKPLGQAIQLRLLTTGRDLLRLQQPPKPAQAPVVIANPAFERVGRATPRPTLLASNAVSQSRSAELGAKVWFPLPGSEREGQQIGALLATAPVTGAAATTRRLQQINGPLVLHIASHGFFVGDVETKPDDPLRTLQEQSSLLRSLRQEDPQLRSGLVLAGANQPDADPNDDGYLTAAEAVALKLDGTELVVLSACSTGQGEVRTGEGVYGLQRSLAVAGARSTLLSLWKVDDAATAEFMRRFYSRLKAGDGRSDALAAVQQEFRSGNARNSSTGERWDSPYYWAAWQLVGDWRPIKGL